MKHITLTKEEEKIMRDYDDGKYVPVENFEKEKKQFEKIAQFTINKRKNINIRISEKDLLKLKARALERGIPYQTLASSILHQFSNEKIKELTR
jgi:predicted DNA binding CopG/RHH family protein